MPGCNVVIICHRNLYYVACLAEWHMCRCTCAGVEVEYVVPPNFAKLSGGTVHLILTDIPSVKSFDIVQEKFADITEVWQKYFVPPVCPSTTYDVYEGNPAAFWLYYHANAQAGVDMVTSLFGSGTDAVAIHKKFVELGKYVLKAAQELMDAAVPPVCVQRQQHKKELSKVLKRAHGKSSHFFV